MPHKYHLYSIYFISGISEVKIPFVAAFEPVITIVKEGESYVVTGVTPLKTVSHTFTDGGLMETDFFGSDKTAQAK